MKKKTNDSRSVNPYDLGAISKSLRVFRNASPRTARRQNPYSVEGIHRLLKTKENQKRER